MKIVIDIPEEVKQTFDNAKDEDLYGNYYDRNSLMGKAIQNGIPLPTGHGRLIDADALYNDLIFPNEQFGKAFKDILNDAPTIIESESEE